ncbi:unnamed protein product [Durusdinium trenchii]|uniref:HTH La-type RNA-binding domain-containing protein n=1 Tax=Durusdinium trenchii TaxID=1381693 RepID=A0ABP0PJG0_9DINO
MAEEAEKPKEEPKKEEAKPEEAKPGEKRKDASAPEDAKRLKPTPPDPQAEKPKEEPKKEEAKPGEKRKDASAPEDAKRLKPTPPDPQVVRLQVEYYLSDENLKYDKFFHEKITADKDGWLELQLILSCNKMKNMRATKEDVIAALKESKIELNEGQTALRRPGNAALSRGCSRLIRRRTPSMRMMAAW